MLPRLLLAALVASPVATAEPFSFVALGDTTYAIPADHPIYGGLIDAINASRPAFSIHVGDTKGAMLVAMLPQRRRSDQG